MNDSFLNDIDPGDPGPRQELNQFITTRKSRSSGGPVKNDDFEFLTQENINTITNAGIVNKKELLNDQKKKSTKQHDFKKQIEHEKKIPLIESKVLDKKLKSLETRGKSTELARVKCEELKTKHQILRNKVSDPRQISKDYNRRSGSSTPSSRTSDPSSKENNILSDNVTPNRNSASLKKLETNDSSTLLNCVKELISSNAKQESTKILRAMQELHINSQANLIKHLLIQTEDLTKEIHPSRDTSRLKKLVEENERMREDIIILKLRNEELQRKVDESILMKEENIELKLKIKELLKSGS
ncbi:uncharacterized protein LOC127279782 [Leptopilina boulardi]|uniref:uncharacterized protein LOC127279782 n=1 Tax=Leptopilina boulardi TaxID=63433 RepID=UPI0021F54697|nr:uncharacterized protein LOC127279782 [Leptopilina boulardi]